MKSKKNVGKLVTLLLAFAFGAALAFVVRGVRPGPGSTAEGDGAQAGAASGAEARTEWTGELVVEVADDFKGGRSSTHFSLRDDAGRSRDLSLENLPPGLQGGDRVRVTGTMDGGHIRVDKIEAFEP